MGKSKMRLLVRESMNQISEQDRKEVLEWAEKSLVVVQSRELSPRQKYALLVNRQTPKSARLLLAGLFRLIKSKAWTGQSWARRLGLIGAVAGGAGLGGKAAGVVTMGLGLSVSLPFISTLMATFLGVIIDESRKEVREFKQSRNQRNSGK